MEPIKLNLSDHNGCYNVTIAIVLQMANLAENCGVNMVLVLQMANIGGQLPSQRVVSAMKLIQCIRSIKGRAHIIINSVLTRLPHPTPPHPIPSISILSAVMFAYAQKESIEKRYKPLGQLGS